ncbi:MAG: TonB-dependent receptor [Prolixibacteraceae bacterium]|jgi:TonB-linked SusC/RagA family outer membrane protein
MKKKHESDGLGLLSRSVFKILRVMKLMMVLICFVGLLSSFGKSYSQNTKLSVEFKSSTIESVLNYIESRTDYSFMYDNKKIDVSRKINISAKDKTVEAILDQLFDNGVSYKMIGKHIIITHREEQPSISSDQQQKSISGKVTDSSGAPIPGVSIVVKGTTTGTITDSNGNYSLSNIPENATLQVSFVGMKTQEIQVAGKTTIAVVMEEETIGIDEVVAVGYGTQKKVNLSGSVSSVSSETLAKSSVQNTANLLQGRMPGLEIIQPSGKPGNDDPSIRIRGIGSYGASISPLVLIDGIAGSLASIAPDNIETVTVLKDAASASIYGARAANGVILITSKNAKNGESSLEYTLNVGIQNATRIPEFIWNSAEYMEMYNSARLRNGQTAFYTQEQIDSYKNATDRTQYPNFNWPEYYFKTATVYNHTLNFAKATEASKFRLGLNYSDQDGILPVFKSKKFTANLNYENQILKGVNIGSTINLFYNTRTEPQANDDFSLIKGIYGRSPLASPFLPDGRKASGRAYSTEPFSTIAPITFTNGKREYDTYTANAQVFAIIDIAKGLQWESKGAVGFYNGFSKLRAYSTASQYYYYQKLPGEEDYTIDQSVGDPFTLGLSNNYSVTIVPTLNSVLRYNTNINRHAIGAMLGYEQTSSYTRSIYGYRQTFASDHLDELDAGSSVGQNLNGTSSEWALQSFFGRVNYAFKDRYLFEGNMRYDGTSRVQAAHRWGIFPSFSGAWRISEESFIKDNLKWINNLKIRGSYGILGNQGIGDYPYQSVFSFKNYSYGSIVDQGVVVTKMTDKNLQWEKTKILNFGIDADAFNGLIGIGLDWYKKDTYDILAKIPVALSVGVDGPVSNNGKLQNKGLELELRHSNRIGELHYNVNFQVAGFKNKLVSIVTPTKGVNEVGLPYNSFYLYEWEGIFQSQDEIDNSATQNNNPKPGDLKIKDQNGDKIIDANDRRSYDPYPQFSYSLNMNLEWKRFNLSIFLQGVEGSHVLLSDYANFPFREGIPPKAEFRNAWTSENHSNSIPAIHTFDYVGVYGYTSTYLLKNSSYLRLKNIYLSYALPERILHPLKMKEMSVYFSGDNLVTFSNFDDGDPEVSQGTSVYQYPQVRSMNVGVKIKF